MSSLLSMMRKWSLAASRRLAARPLAFRPCDEPIRRRAQALRIQRFDDVPYSRYGRAIAPANRVARILAHASPPSRSRREILRARLTLATPALLPELRLYRAGPHSGLARLLSGGGAPYWAYPWAGGLALARYLLDHPGTIAGKRVLDLGAGGGLVAIAAMKAGARAATAIDIDPDALDAIALNAEANAVAVAAICGDPLDGPPPAVDIVLVGDLFYEASLAARATAFLDRCREAGVGALIGDPGRAPLPRARLKPLAEYQLADFGDAPDATTTASAVFAFV
jgi:predicted nicotinamide N-methyase